MGKKSFYKGFTYHQDFKAGIGLKYKKVFEIVDEDKSVLEIGCHTGYLGKVLKERGNEAWGVEINKEAANKAKRFYEKILIGDIEDKDLWNTITRKFDVILILDTLEHLIDPWRLLTKSKNLLNPKGFLLMTIPNVAFYEIRKNLLFGKFDYRESGILDRSHLRFFTFNSAQKLILDCGYDIEEWSITVSEFPFEYKLPLLQKIYHKTKKLFSNIFPNLFGAVIFFKIIPKK